MQTTNMTIRELKLLLKDHPDESVLVYSTGLNEQSFTPVLKIEIPFMIKEKETEKN